MAQPTIQFEGIKTAFRQTKDGYNLTLAVHPDEVPTDLITDFVGSRYMVVMVRLGDDDQPLDPGHFRRDRVHQQAGRIGRAAAGHIDADGLERSPAPAEFDAERVGEAVGHGVEERAARAGEAARAGHGAVEQVDEPARRRRGLAAKRFPSLWTHNALRAAPIEP